MVHMSLINQIKITNFMNKLSAQNYIKPFKIEYIGLFLKKNS